MNSMVSWMWQLEVKAVRICQTLIKNQQGQAKHYFYSDKQFRVLRKKQSQVSEILEEYQKRSGVFLKLVRKNLTEVSIELSNLLECQQILSLPKSQVQISLISNKNSNLLRILYSHKNQKVSSIEYLLEGHSSDRPSLQIGVKQICDRLCRIVEEKIGQNNKVISLDIILIEEPTKQILLVDALELKTQRPSTLFPPISFKPSNKISIPSLQTKRNLTPVQAQQKFLEQLPSEQMENLQIDKSHVVDSKQCKCCGQETIQWKQVSVQEVVNWRKMRSKPIRGLNEEFYPVCLSCYQQI